MDVLVTYDYMESYLPSKRHRKLRFREAKGETTVTINEASKDEAPVAFVVHEKLHGAPVEIRFWNSKLWKPLMWNDKEAGGKGLYPLHKLVESLKYHSRYKANKTMDEAIREKHGYALMHLVVDGIVYQETDEPRYVIMTFGLGHNHGGTSMFVEDWYNPNISRHCYFNALERDKAISYGRETAEIRGDTDSVESIGKYCNIEVLMPEIVKCNPQLEHGEGDPFLNKLESVTVSSSSIAEAGLLVMAITDQELQKN